MSRKVLHLASAWLLSLAVFLSVSPQLAGARSRASEDRCDVPPPVRQTTVGSDHLMTLQCDLAGTGFFTDQITVFKRTGMLNSNAQNWQDAPTFVDEVWIFDYQRDGKAELIIEYRREGQALVADLYDVPDGSDEVAYELSENHFVLRPQRYPTVKVVAPDGWWTNGALINANLDIYVDGIVEAVFDVRRKIDKVFKNDGVVDFKIHIRDADHDGRPEHDWRTVFFQEPVPAVAATIPRSYLMVNVRDDEPPIAPTWPWPYLATVSFGYLTSSPHQVTHPPIHVDWRTGKIVTVGEFVSSRGNDGQWFVYSFNEIEPEQLTVPNFESPFAWYDLAQDRDGQPELAIRLGHHDPYDRVMLSGRFPRPVNVVRYSWDQNNDGYWDYKLGLLGNNTVDHVVSLLDMRMKMVSYDLLPKWVVTHPWGVAFFVAAETLAVGEGIYVWDPPAWLTEGYFTGISNDSNPPSNARPEERFDQIPVGFRGELQLDLQDRPLLYLSTIDRKLHLLRAKAGLWNISDQKELRYENLGGDYVNKWMLIENGVVTRRLLFAADQLLLVDITGVRIKTLDQSPSLFTTLPPRDHQEWVLLRDLLEQNKASFAGDDLQGMFDQFAGTTQTLPGTSLSNFRLTADGFRFTLDLPRGGVDNVPWATTLDAGKYLVYYRTGRSYSVERLTPPNLTMQSLALVNPQPVALRATRVTATVLNRGLQDAPDVEVIFSAVPMADGHSVVLGSRTVSVLSHESKPVTQEWIPPKPGLWQLHVTTRTQASQRASDVTESLQVEVLPAAQPELWETVSGFGLVREWAIVALLGSVTVLGVTLVLYVVREGSKAE